MSKLDEEIVCNAPYGSIEFDDGGDEAEEDVVDELK